MSTSDPRPMTEAELEQARIGRTGGDRSRLEWSGFKVYSQSDEDGIIAEIFRRIGIAHRTFVEFGCEVGLENNSRLLLEQGWRGLWIEGLPDYAGAVRANFQEEIEEGRLTFLPAMVSRENINNLIASSGLPGEIDFLSIDIDSIDYHVFEAIDVISPRVVCLEHNRTFDDEQEWVMPYDESYRWDPASGRVDFGASPVAMAKLAARKGYTLVGWGLFSSNGFYVRNDLVGQRFTGPFTVARLRNPTVYASVLRFPQAPYERIARPRTVPGPVSRPELLPALSGSPRGLRAFALRVLPDRATAILRYVLRRLRAR